MTVILFIAILVILVIVHEVGHFIVAKRAGIRVDEFGIGYPPRVWGKRIGETLYSINALPFGGFVKIFGENLEDEARSGPQSSQSFVTKPKWIQALVLAAGIIFNLLFAWLLISGTYMTGTPAAAGSGMGTVSNPRLTVVEVLPNSPASGAGVKVGDVIASVNSGDASNTIANPDAPAFSNFISSHENTDVVVTFDRSDKTYSATMKPAVVEGSGAEGKIIGVSMEMVGLLKLPIHKALWEGLKSTGYITAAIVSGIWTLLHNAFVGQGDFSQVAGPVGIANLVGDARDLGWSYVVTFTAFISINLAIINLIPFPALDGGRILFVAIEAIRRKPISAKVAGTVNFVGFALLIILMLVVTFNDILRLVR